MFDIRDNLGKDEGDNANIYVESNEIPFGKTQNLNSRFYTWARVLNSSQNPVLSRELNQRLANSQLALASRYS